MMKEHKKHTHSTENNTGKQMGWTRENDTREGTNIIKMMHEITTVAQAWPWMMKPTDR